jgi:hypothetical protein
MANEKMKEYVKEALEIYETTDKKLCEVVKEIKEKYNLPQEPASIERAVQRLKKSSNLSGHSFLKKECEEVGIPLEDVNFYWYKGEFSSIKVNTNNPVKTYESIRDFVVEEMQQYSPKYPTIKRSENKDGHLLVVDPADIHIGKLARAIETGDPYDSQIAVKRVMEGVHGIIDKARGFHIDKILFIGGNDVLHIDSPRRTTTSGTPQDTDGMWYDNFLIAKKLYIDVLEILISIADVHFVFNPSNHDMTNGFFLADVIHSWFRNNKNITFDCSPSHRKYFKYGNNLIGSTHGDGAKAQDLPLLMAIEAKDMWADTKHRYVYSHHLHHKVSKDYANITVESLRSPSGSDSWHHKNGYQHSPKALEGFIHHKEFGQVARLSHIF